MGQIRNRVVQRVTIFGQDTKSGKAVNNIWDFRNNTDSGPPLAYDAPLPGAPTLAGFLANFRTAFEATFVTLLSVNYAVISYAVNNIIGKKFTTPLQPISTLTLGLGGGATIGTVNPHGLVTGNTVVIDGVTTPLPVNGTWEITRITDFQFSLNGGVFAGAWSGNGTWQKAFGKFVFLSTDAATLLPVAGGGGVAGEALPLFDTVSVRKKTTTPGRSGRGRSSMSPIAESQALNGKLTAGALTAWQAAFATNLTVPIANGGTDPGSGAMLPVVTSLIFASMQPATFLQSETWAHTLNAYIVQPNLGSLVRRKPRLSAPIA